jgi:hypothetical protein
MLIFGFDNDASELCRRAEAATAAINELGPVQICVRVVENFDLLSENDKMRSSPAMYRRSDRTILLNRSAGFLALPADFQDAIFMHEVGHAYAHQVLDHDVEVDLRACRWGFRDGLVAHRRLDDPKYADILARVATEDETSVREELHALHRRRLHGVERK